MPSFQDLEEKFGEIVAQAVLENLERYEGVRANTVASLEDRWQILMQAEAQALAA